VLSTNKLYYFDPHTHALCTRYKTSYFLYNI